MLFKMSSAICFNLTSLKFCRLVMGNFFTHEANLGQYSFRGLVIVVALEELLESMGRCTGRHEMTEITAIDISLNDHCDSNICASNYKLNKNHSDH